MVIQLKKGEQIISLEKNELYGWILRIKGFDRRMGEYERAEKPTDKEAAELIKNGMRGKYTWARNWQSKSRKLKPNDFGGVF